MAFPRFPAVAALSAALLLASQGPVAAAAPAHQTLVIGVDHLDLDNQNPDAHRVFEYTEFFSDNVRIHSGDTLDFRTAPGAFHIVAISKNEYKARVAYKVALTDPDDPNAPGSGAPEVLLGPSNGSITNGSTDGGGTIGDPNAFPPGPCGVVQVGQSPCVFNGGQDVESAGPIAGFGPTGPAPVDWQITMNAEPGTYSMFCYVHPRMSATITVVKDSSSSVSTQAQIDTASERQFDRDRALALAAERNANVVRFTGGAPGKRTYQVSVGISAADDRVAIDEMLPQSLNIVRGDSVDYKWRDDHNAHTVSFPTDSPNLPQPFAPDVEANEPFEVAADPGNAPKGTALVRPTDLVDSGVLFGTKYYLQPSTQFWGITTNSSTTAGTYQYQCVIHDFMHGSLAVSP